MKQLIEIVHTEKNKDKYMKMVQVKITGYCCCEYFLNVNDFYHNNYECPPPESGRLLT